MNHAFSAPEKGQKRKELSKVQGVHAGPKIGGDTNSEVVKRIREQQSLESTLTSAGHGQTLREWERDKRELIEHAKTTSSRAAIDRMHSYVEDLPKLVACESIGVKRFHALRSKRIYKISRENIKKLRRIRSKIPMPDRDTLLSKIITREQRESYLSNGERRNTIGGFFGRAQDTKGLMTSVDYYRVNRLDYKLKDGSTNFTEHQEFISVIRFTTENVSAMEIPYGGLDGRDLKKMRNATGLRKSQLLKQNPPYSGNGFTASKEERTIPELKTKTGRFLEINRGAAMYDIYHDGAEVLKAVFNGDKWITVN